MADWKIEFIVHGKYLDQILEVLQPYKVENLDMKIVAGTPTKIRKGDQPGWGVVAAASTSTPQRGRYFAGKLKEAGFSNKGIATHLSAALKNGLVKRVKIKGVSHYVKAGK